LKVTLATVWTQYPIPISGPYPSGIVSPFGYIVTTSDQPVSDAGPRANTTFFVDDIEWQP
jgi:hypothetical protein